MSQDTMDVVFQALASAVRREMLDIVKDQPGCCVNDVCAHFTMSRIAVMKHLRILENAQLIVSEKVGRTRVLYFNAVPIQMIYDRWTTEFSALWANRLTRIKYRVEADRTAEKRENDD
jgi:predicted transcriptional regulator